MTPAAIWSAAVVLAVAVALSGLPAAAGASFSFPAAAQNRAESNGRGDTCPLTL